MRFRISTLLLQYKPVYQFIYNAQQKHYYCRGINNMHHLKVKAGWPVRIFFAEEIHNTKLIKKESPPIYIGGLYLFSE